jgi:PAS domain S-box-containing protein
VIVNSNTAAGSFFNLTAEQMRGKSLFELGWQFAQDDGSPVPPGEHPTEVALRTGRPVRHAVLGLHPQAAEPMEHSASGRQRYLGRWLLINAMPLGGPAARAGVVTTFSDVTAYVQARESIRLSEERYRGLVESLPLMLVQADTDLRLVYANPAATRITGYSADELREPSAWANHIHPDDVARAFEIGREALAGREGRCELRYRAKDGTEKFCYAMSQPRYVDGAIAGTTTLLVDVTRERQLESELGRARRLEVVGRLSSGVAHDFNNLLSVVLNLTDLARSHLPREHPVHADLRRISEACEQAASLAAQLLRFSKQQPAGARQLDLGPVVLRALELVRATLPSNITLEQQVAAEPMPIVADETQLQQVLMNLCLNARDAMPGGGTLRVTCGKEPPAGGGNGARPVVRLSVEDTGQGISDELRGRIFEPYFSTKDGGTGLGLAVVQQIVESYGGTIAVNSAPGSGSHFDIRWPEA